METDPLNIIEKAQTPESAPPWAGRYSEATEVVEEAELYVVYVARLEPGGGRWSTAEEATFPCSDGPGPAVAKAQGIVDSFLAENHTSDMTAGELFARYRQEGPDPYIRYESRGRRAHHWVELELLNMAVPFNAWGYAETACRQLCGEESGESSCNLALWQGRYHDYDRKRMEAQLLLGRRVRLTRDCSGMIGDFPAGTAGVIGMHAHYIEDSIFDWRVELPVILRRGRLSALRRWFGFLYDLPDNREEVTFGIPYAALEFVESNEKHMERLREDWNR